MPPGPRTALPRYRFGVFVLDPAKRELLRDGEPLVLPARAFECLHFLIEHRDRAVERDELVRAVFARANVSDTQLAQIVLRARRAIGDDGQEQRVIRTVPRFGFRWAEPVTVLYDEDDAASPAPVAHELREADNAAAPSGAPGTSATVPPQYVPALLAKPRRAPAGRWRRLLADCGAGLAAMLLLALSVLPWPLPRLGDARAQADDRAIIVLPVDVSGGSDATWARLGMMDYLVDRMRRAQLPVWSSEATLGLLRSHTGQPDPQQLRRSTHAAWIVQGRARNDDRQWQVELTAFDDSGRTRRGVGHHADLISATRVAADRLLATIDSAGGARRAAPEDPPGLDERLQRAQSAVLANDLDGARRIVVEAPSSQRFAPQLEFRLAQIDFLAGRHQQGLATTQRLLQGNAARLDRAFRGRLLALQGALLVRLDRFADAERSFDAAIARIDPADAAELGGALLGRGVAHSVQGEFEAALADLGSARIQLVRAGDRLSVARVDGNLGTLEMERGRPLQAVPYFQKAERDFEAMGAVAELNGMRFMLALAHLQVLQPTAALAAIERAWVLRDQIHDPVQIADLLLVRAEALIAVGRLREARELLVLPEAAAVSAVDFHRREYLLMEVARQSGDARTTARLANAALRDWPADKNPRLRAWAAFRQREAALEADLPAPTDDAQIVGDAVAGKLGAALDERRAGRADAAQARYREAVALAESGGIPEQVADAVQAHARWLMEAGRLDEAAALIGRVAPWAEQDFELALLQVELYSRLRQPGQWHAALDQARRLAGERPIPPALRAARPSGAPARISASN